MIYQKHPRFTKEMVKIPLTLGTEVPISDLGDFVSRVYLENLESGSTVDVLVNGNVIQTFTTEYITIRKNLTTPLQKLLTDCPLTVLPCSNPMPASNMSIRVNGYASDLFVDYILVETPTPRVPVLIEQVQFETFVVSSGIPVFTSFRHLVKEIYMVTENVKLTRIQFKMNENVKFDQSGLYFNKVQPTDYHSRAPTDDSVYTYSFCMNPESQESTGSLNIGRVQHQSFTFFSDTPVFKVTVYAITLNILAKDGSLLFV